MVSMVLSLFVLLSLQPDVFKKEKAPLESAVDTEVTSTGAQVLQRSRATYLEGYGIVVTLEVAFEGPQNPFSSPKRPEEIRTLVAQRRKQVQEKLSTFIKQRVASIDSIGSSDSLVIVIHVLNANPADVPNLPVQIQISVKKESPQQVSLKDF